LPPAVPAVPVQPAYGYPQEPVTQPAYGYPQAAAAGTYGYPQPVPVAAAADPDFRLPPQGPQFI
jgi:hypothetical protein